MYNPPNRGELYKTNTLVRKTHIITTQSVAMESKKKKKKNKPQRVGESIYLAAALVVSLVCLRNGIKSVPPVP